MTAPAYLAVVNDETTALLIIRAWTEPSSSKPLRAMVRVTNDVSKGFEDETSYADADAVYAAVQRWLESVSAN